jgi:hypothetical protein
VAQTARSLIFEEPSRPGNRPDWVADVVDLGAVLVPARPESLEAPDFAGSLEPSGASAVPSASPLSVAVDELGQYVVQDIVGGAYGVAPAPEEAFADYWTALDERLEFLRARRDALSVRLARQLHELEELFPGR